MEFKKGDIVKDIGTWDKGAIGKIIIFDRFWYEWYEVYWLTGACIGTKTQINASNLMKITENEALPYLI